MSTDFLMYDNIVSALQPIDVGTGGASTAWFDMKLAHSVSFLATFGVITATSANTVTLTVEASTTNSSTTGVAVPFLYRQSGVVTANTWGAVTSCTSAGLALAASAATGTNVWIEADLAAITTDHPTARWIKAEIVAAEPTALLAGILAVVHPRYHNVTMYTST